MSDAGEVALRLADRLVGDAVWHGPMCTWLGPAVDPADVTGDVTWVPVGPSLYDGDAGIGLVLAEVGAYAGDAACMRTAAAALRHAIGQAADIDRRLVMGLHTGRPGVGLAAVRVGLLTGAGDLVEAGRELLLSSTSAGTTTVSIDLVRGRAGAVVALLAAASALGDRSLKAAALAVSDEVLAMGSTHGVWRWEDAQTGSGLLATGLSHGPSGVGVALLESWRATGEVRLRRAATAAFASEDEARDGAVANWLGGEPAENSPPRLVGTTLSHMHWCHGAPGIALARHRAWRLTGDEDQRVVCGEALHATASWVSAGVAARRGGFCLCHGLAGNAKILADCADAAPGSADRFSALRAAVALAGVEDHVEGERPWPCGTLGGESPGLMTGLAGIALFYLRIAEPGVPSVLLVRPEEWVRSDRSGT